MWPNPLCYKIYKHNTSRLIFIKLFRAKTMGNGWRELKNLEAVKALLLIRTTPTDSANGMFINLAFYDFLIRILCLY